MFPLKLHINTQSALKLIFTTLLLAAAVVALIQFAPQNETARIAFSSFDGNDFEIFTVNPDGSDLIQLTDNTIDDWGATWSPDRQQLAFRSGSNDASAIYVMDADGQNVEMISAPQMTVGNPYYQATMSWSPDGTQLAFSANFNGNWDIWLTSLDRLALVRLTHDAGDDLHPDWSPDGTQIVFNRYSDGLLEIFVVDVDGRNVNQLTKNENAMTMFPRWSPNGDEIVYFINTGNLADLYVMNRDGSNSRQLTFDIAVDRVATYSPDGESVVFRSERDGDSDIYTMNLNTGEITPISFNNTMDIAPDW